MKKLKPLIIDWYEIKFVTTKEWAERLKYMTSEEISEESRRSFEKDLLWK